MEHPLYAAENETIESLLLMAVLGQGLVKNLALRELRRRRLLMKEGEFKDLYTINFSIVVCGFIRRQKVLDSYRLGPVRYPSVKNSSFIGQ